MNYDAAMWHQAVDQYGRQYWVNNHTGQATYQLHGGVGGLPSLQQYTMAYPAPPVMGMPPAGMIGPSYQPVGEATYGSNGNSGFAGQSSERARTALGVAQTVGMSLLLAAGTVRSNRSHRSGKVLGIPYRT